MTKAGYVYGLIGTILSLLSRVTPVETLILVPFVSASLAYISNSLLERRRERFERRQRIETLLHKSKDEHGEQ